MNDTDNQRDSIRLKMLNERIICLNQRMRVLKCADNVLTAILWAMIVFGIGVAIWRVCL